MWFYFAFHREEESEWGIREEEEGQEGGEKSGYDMYVCMCGLIDLRWWLRVFTSVWFYSLGQTLHAKTKKKKKIYTRLKQRRRRRRRRRRGECEKKQNEKKIIICIETKRVEVIECFSYPLALSLCVLDVNERRSSNGFNKFSTMEKRWRNLSSPSIFWQ